AQRRPDRGSDREAASTRLGLAASRIRVGRHALKRASFSPPRVPERLLPIVIADVPHALAVLESEDMRDRYIDVHAASTTASVGVEKRDDLVPGVDELLRLVPEVLPVLLQGLHVLTHAVVTPYRNTAERREVRMPRDVRVTLRQDGVDVPAVARLVDPLRRGHVCP